MNTVQERSSPPIGTQDISDRLEAQPYRPFTVHFADSRRIAFPRRRLLASVPNGRTVTDSLAAAAGLRAGDVVVEVNRKRVSSADAALEASRQGKETRVLLRVWREGTTRYVVVEASKAN